MEIIPLKMHFLVKSNSLYSFTTKSQEYYKMRYNSLLGDMNVLSNFNYNFKVKT